MESKEEELKYKVPKAPRPKITIIPKEISAIKLIEIDDDSDSSQNEKKSNSSKIIEKYNDDPYLSDDKFQDSFDDEFGDEYETKPDSGKINLAEK